MDLKEYKKSTTVITFCLKSIYVLILVYFFSSFMFEYFGHNTKTEINTFKQILKYVLGCFSILLVYNVIKVLKAVLSVLFYSIIKNKDKLL